jgi:ribosomal protein S18 acetylase RimI-like enzyme
MIDDPKQGMITRQILSSAEIAEVEQLARICNNYEQLDMRIDWVELRPEYFGNIHDCLYYENDQLIGYLFLKRFGTSQKEITGMVHPTHRRRGIFSRMIAAAKEECRAKGVQHLLLICERDSPSGQAFVATLGGKLDFSEHKMVLENFHERLAFDDRLSFQRAYTDDLDALVTITLMSEGWSRSAEEVRRSLSFNLREPHCQVYIARFGGNELSCGEPVGRLRVYDMGQEVGIYGFLVRPEYRGRGYGRQMLEEVIREIRANSANSAKSIMLEVDTDNIVALNLYRSTGFAIKRTYDYIEIGVTV